MKIDFWLDPVCPWCWLTSRWLVRDVAPARNLEINWRPISLLFKNQPDPESEWYAPLAGTRDLLRVFLAVKEAHGNDAAGEFYTAAGTEIHNNQNRDVTAAQILQECRLPTELAEAANDEARDETIKSEMQAGLDLVGNDVGTPIIAFESGEAQIGVFGPVISRVPDPAQSLEIWDSMVTLSKLDSFWELKRTRTEQPNFDY